mmetsp:Transcript_20442/g.36878  ORF Transcript_20442/g.36878 Transcript_20442/m.36878 type:complete len:103 (+) Transcript_20442:12-320(+)
MRATHHSQLAQLLQAQLNAEEQAAAQPPARTQVAGRMHPRGAGGADGSADDVWNHAENRPYTQEELAYMREMHQQYSARRDSSRRSSKKPESSSSGSSCAIS